MDPWSKFNESPCNFGVRLQCFLTMPDSVLNLCETFARLVVTVCQPFEPALARMNAAG